MKTCLRKKVQNIVARFAERSSFRIRMALAPSAERRAICSFPSMKTETTSRKTEEDDDQGSPTREPFLAEKKEEMEYGITKIRDYRRWGGRELASPIP
jgi:hypothetical protein